MAIEKIAISDLERTTLQTRVLLSADTVDDYAEAMRNRAKFPPVTVFADAEKDTLWLADGFHRVAAAGKLLPALQDKGPQAGSRQHQRGKHARRPEPDDQRAKALMPCHQGRAVVHGVRLRGCISRDIRVMQAGKHSRLVP